MIKKATPTAGKESGKDELPELSQELSNYLLLIHQLLEEKGYVRGVELAERLEMSRPTVTRAIQRLAQLGYAHYERYRGITLSKAGIEAAAKANSRCQTVLRFLEATGAPFHNIKSEARRLSAAGSEDLLNALRVATERLKK
jgi:Mn-dependent DtxR family transcriptional regulator